MKIKAITQSSLPERAHPTDAGMDLKVYESIELEFGVRTLVRTGLHVAIPKGYVGLLVPRSSLSKRGIVMTNSIGIIDSDYRGEILASLMYNTIFENRTSIKLERNEKLVQLVIVPILIPVLEDESTMHMNQWTNTDRGLGGFGSTDK